jgi:hypothetical protein
VVEKEEEERLGGSLSKDEPVLLRPNYGYASEGGESASVLRKRPLIFSNPNHIECYTVQVLHSQADDSTCFSYAGPLRPDLHQENRLSN